MEQGPALSAKASRLRIALVSALACLTSLPVAAQLPRTGGETITVQRIVIDARIIDSRGDPITDVKPSDLEAFVDDVPATVEAADFIREDEAVDMLVPDSKPGMHVMYDSARGRKIVLFFQTDFQRERAKGQMRMMTHAKEFIRTLGPEDKVAVVSWDSKLRIQEDFTNDLEKLDAAIEKSIEIRPVHWSDDGRWPSLAAGIDEEKAENATSPEKALRFIGEALQDIDGTKSLVMFGWGIGVYAGHGLIIYPDYAQARMALEVARTSVFSLDITDADWHTLESGLGKVAEDTGGFYKKTHIFPRMAIDKLRRTISGRYEIVLVKPVPHKGFHKVRIRLKTRAGEVLARDMFMD